MAKQRKPDFPNNWKVIQQAPDEAFREITYEEFFEWRVHGWEIPEPHLCVIRVYNRDTQRVSEYSYKKVSAANKCIEKLTKNPANEITIADDDEITLLRAIENETED